MKYSKRYVVFTLILIIIFVSDFYIFAKDNTTLGEFRGAEIESTVWSPLVAKDVNKNTIHMMIDNKEYTSDTLKFYMDDDRNIMVPVDMLREALNCSARIYQENELWVEKHSLMADYMLGTDNDFILYDGKFYVSMNSLSEMLDCTCTFDTNTNTLTVVDNSEGISDVPPSYDLRTRLRVSEVRNQGNYGTCWAFAAISALESSLMPEENLLFSVDHMSMSNSFNVNQYDGGEYTMGMAYLAAWQGPVYEKDDPYGDGATDESLSPVKHVQEIRIIDGKDYQGIKEAVFKYGGVQTSLYSNISSSKGNSKYFNKDTNAYCYMGSEKPNHDVVIIGWDDNYPKENFNVDLEGDGAFICQNSWGNEFGDDGFFYVSYYDTNIGTHNEVYTGVENTDNYDNIYQSDLCGWVGKMGYDKEDMYGANVFTATSDQNIKAASFYATASDTSYELYIVNDFKDEYSFADRKKVAEGTLENAGYYTIKFDEEVPVTEGERYAVVLHINTPESTHPMAIEYDSGESYLKDVDLDDGEGYISYDGAAFINVKEKQDCNLCIKAFSDNK
nr:lectin like domain-containing protein [uncultured Agathobacter sp.]